MAPGARIVRREPGGPMRDQRRGVHAIREGTWALGPDLCAILPVKRSQVSRPFVVRIRAQNENSHRAGWLFLFWRSHGDCESACDQSSADSSEAPNPGASDRWPERSWAGPAGQGSRLGTSAAGAHAGQLDREEGGAAATSVTSARLTTWTALTGVTFHLPAANLVT